MIRTITKALYFFLSLLVAPSFAEYEGEGPSDSYVFATKLNIREAPKPDGKLLIQLRIGE